MKAIGHTFVICACALLLGRGLANQAIEHTTAEEQPRGKHSDCPTSTKHNTETAKKISSLYPCVQMNRSGEHPFFSEVIEVCRLPVAGGAVRLVVWVHVVVPGMVDHGWGEVLIFNTAQDAAPIVRLSAKSLGVGRSADISLINNKWLQFGVSSPLVSLADEDSLKVFAKCGLNNECHGLSIEAAKPALQEYLRNGREGFLKLVPATSNCINRIILLPERIRDVIVYDTLVEDMRPSGFKYSSSWEGTIFVKVIPECRQEKPIIIEMGSKGSNEGININEVELLLWEIRVDEPVGRPVSR